MTFNPSIPVNSDSPGVYPAQNQVNMARLQTLIGADHQFNLSAAANDGYHNVVHLTQQAPSGALAGVGRAYGKSVSGAVQLYYMDSAGVEYQVTPAAQTGPIKVTGSQSMAGGALLDLFNVAYDYQGYGEVFISGSGSQFTYCFYRSGSTTNIAILTSNNGGPARPTLGFGVGQVLQTRNNSGGTQTVVWSLMINRI